MCCAVFAMMLASHPYQYQFSIWDAFSELSLLFLLVAINIYLRGGGFWTPVGFAFLAFLSKETYFVSAIFMAGTYAISERLKPTSLLPGVGIIAAGVGAFVCERLIGSPFTAGGAGPDDPYRVVVGFASVWHQWLQYLSEGFNPASAAVVVLAIAGVAVGAGPRSKQALWSTILPAAGLAALLPNCLLPNHHFAAYTWNTAYFFYAPIVMLGVGSGRKVVSLAIVIATFGVALYSPLLSAKAFADQEWFLMNQRRQRNLLSAMSNLARAIPAKNESILVSGLDFPYSMFEYKSAAKSLGAPVGTRFYVVDYHAGKPASIVTLFNRSDDSVSLVSPVRAETLRFDEAWLIRDDGTLIAKLRSPELPAAKDGFSPGEMLVYPALIDILGSVVHESPDGYAYLRCGTRLLAYGNLALARRYLEASRTLIPDNPYPYYWLGVTFEQEGLRSEARKAYQGAVAHEAASPNPVFRNALAALQ